jgi:hypothetical protein
MWIEVLNWIGSICTVLGTYEVSKKKADLKRVNTLYCIACVILIAVFSVYQNYAMITMYAVLLVFSINGIRNNTIPYELKNMIYYVYDKEL